MKHACIKQNESKHIQHQPLLSTAIQTPKKAIYITHSQSIIKHYLKNMEFQVKLTLKKSPLTNNVANPEACQDPSQRHLESNPFITIINIR